MTEDSKAKVKFPEFQYIEFVSGSYTNRNTIIKLSDLPGYLANAQKSSCWISHFRSKEDFKTYTANNLKPVYDKKGKEICQRPSVEGYEGPGFSSYLWTDIDQRTADDTPEALKDALSKALSMAQKLLGRLLHEYELNTDFLRCYFSGSKGFHVGIPIEAFGLEPSEDFHHKCKHLALSIADDLGIDDSLYDRTRLFRIPNTIHNTSGLYKIELSANEILECADIQIIIDMAKAKRNYQAARPDPEEIAGDLAHLLDDYRETKRGESGQRRKTRTDHDYAGILAGKLEGESRTHNLTILAGHWYNRGFSVDEAVEMGKAWDSANDLGLDSDPQYKNQYPVGKVAGTVEAIYKGNVQRNVDASTDYKRLDDLEGKEFAPIKWIAGPYIPEGLALFVGKPKLGKSWLMLNLALAVACGGTFLSSIQVDPGAVLYLDLDGNERRLKRRCEKILQGESFPAGFFYEHRHSRGETGVKRITNWLERHEDARLIIIDTFVKFRDLSGTKNVNIYEKDTHDLGILEKLADAFQIAVICVHHARKATSDDILDLASGSTGMGGGVNTNITMKKDRSRSDAVLSITGHDIEEGELEIAIDFDGITGLWALLGDAAEYKMSTERQAIIELLRNAEGALGPKDISVALEKNYNTTRVLLYKMLNEGIISIKERGKYIVNNVNNDTIVNNVNNVNKQINLC